jgi:hypothetical protein
LTPWKDADALLKRPRKLEELAVGWRRLRGRMCWLSAKVTVGIWPDDRWIDWLITRGASDVCEGCWLVDPFFKSTEDPFSAA